MIFNLLSNAVKFSPAGGSVDVAATRVNRVVSVSVVDTGPGIAAEDLRQSSRFPQGALTVASRQILVVETTTRT